MRQMLLEKIARFSMKNYIENESLITKIRIPGVKKEALHIEGGEKGFCVKGEEGKKQFESCFYLGHRVDPNTARAQFTRGTLSLTVPLSKEEIHGWSVPLS